MLDKAETAIEDARLFLAAQKPIWEMDRREAAFNTLAYAAYYQTDLPPGKLPEIGEELLPKRRKRGEHGPKEDKRNSAIIFAVDAVCERYDFRPTRNPSAADKASAPSGCSIVKEALERIGINLEEGTVNSIYGDRDRNAARTL